MTGSVVKRIAMPTMTRANMWLPRDIRQYECHRAKREYFESLPDLNLNEQRGRMTSRVPSTCFTVHGFRSSFRDWAFEQTAFPHEICEAALAHVVGNKAEAAYRRADALTKRRKLMEAWAAFCQRPPPTAEVAFP
jgi:integrase